MYQHCNVFSRHCATLQEEMKRGYFDDFKDLKETQGRLFEPSTALSPPETSPMLPISAARSCHMPG